MKRLLFILSLVLVLMSCDNGTMVTNPFIGTWENNVARYIFTDNYVTSCDLENNIWWSGTYTYDDENIYVMADYRDPEMNDYRDPLVWPYSFENSNKLFFVIYTLNKIN